MREMEALNSRDKKRVLPTWMTAEGPEKRTRAAKTPKRRKMAVVPAAAARPPTVRTAYCLSEAELVDVALGVLIQSRKQEKVLEQLPLAGTDKPALCPTCSELPSPGSTREAEDNGSGARPSGLSPPQGPPGPGSACSRSPEEEEDVFKYVREIFFS
ncbi:cell cycle regulator of non-homologous end joining [Artibeus jamaicensis]|uniref:cell cycle regulator of non-homologous end joining n=1 Tax=Artibeus jamaicensis TaxID=9417 RepID=UPI00235AF7B8|nr:cell cycle regulator of non-homologous end joining [Artibeus jamaicensis]XP_037021757.2 cell cycle regulator of non-homologous end joining [Artibeus jamaicensis]XP_037021758.2 cell cycle regulator of non-homologous end joining [Artibeus jamaicensis]